MHPLSKRVQQRFCAPSVHHPQAFQILSYCCDAAHHSHRKPLDLWGRVCKEVSVAGLLQVRIIGRRMEGGWLKTIEGNERCP